MKPLIQKLISVPSPSGYEAQVRQMLRAEVQPFADEVRVDNLGNLIARLGDTIPNRPKLMLIAHMDETSLIATHIDQHGFVRFLPVGDTPPSAYWGSTVRFLNGVPGIISAEQAPAGSSNTDHAPSFEQMFVDVGATSRADCPLQTGDVAVLERPYLELGSRLSGRAIDSRAGVAILVKTLRQVRAATLWLPYQVFFVFTVQGRVGGRGAAVAAFDIDPHMALVIDLTPGDTPGGPKTEVVLGKGPAIPVRNRAVLTDPRLVDWMIGAARDENIPYQLQTLKAGGEEARAVAATRAGIPVGSLAVPCRYLGTCSEMIDDSDLQNTQRLLLALLQRYQELT